MHTVVFFGVLIVQEGGNVAGRKKVVNDVFIFNNGQLKVQKM